MLNIYKSSVSSPGNMRNAMTANHAEQVFSARVDELNSWLKTKRTWAGKCHFPWFVIFRQILNMSTSTSRTWLGDVFTQSTATSIFPMLRNGNWTESESNDLISNRGICWQGKSSKILCFPLKIFKKREIINKTQDSSCARRSWRWKKKILFLLRKVNIGHGLGRERMVKFTWRTDHISMYRWNHSHGRTGCDSSKANCTDPHLEPCSWNRLTVAVAEWNNRILNPLPSKAFSNVSWKYKLISFS